MGRPNLFLIGAQKSGTSSLHFYLKNHPDIFMAEAKELFYFNHDDSRRPPVERYLTHFESDRHHAYYGESSTYYTMAPRFRGVAERIRAFEPSARLIYVVRHPIERAISGYWQSVRVFEESRGLEAVTPESQYARTSDYALQLREYLEWFPRDQIHVLLFEDLRASTEHEMKRLYEWLGLPAHPGRELYRVVRNESPKLLPRIDRSTGLGRLRASRLWQGWLRNAVPAWLRSRLKHRTEQAIDRESPAVREAEARARERLRPHFVERAADFAELTGLDVASWALEG